MTQYRCTKCNYIFTPKTEKVPTICPYCGDKGGLRMEESVDHMLAN